MDGSGTNLLTYNGAWAAADPMFGDVVEWSYNGLGDYLDGDLVPMVAHDATITNCAPSETFWDTTPGSPPGTYWDYMPPNETKWDT